MHLNRCLLLWLVLLAAPIVAQQIPDSLATYTHYLTYVPKQKPASGKYPLMLFLHGSGERGADLNLVKKNGPPSFLDTASQFPFLVISPQCNPSQWWDAKTLLALLDQVERKYPIDTEREYVTGLSMGGYGTWALAQAAPHRFAAIVPICGGGDSLKLCTIRHLPTWVFHGAKDDAVLPRESERLVAGLQKLGAPVTFTLYPNANHNSWSETYANPKLYTWLLAQRLPAQAVTPTPAALKKYTGTYRTGPADSVLITIEGTQLALQEKHSAEKKTLLAFQPNKFRFKTVTDKWNEIYFETDKKGKILGFTKGPCENTFWTRKP